MLAGLVICGTASLCFALTESLAAWFACRAAIGVAAGLIYAPGMTFVTSLLPIAKATIVALKELGAKPFVVAAMGSHGGATPAGQRELLAPRSRIL